MNYAMFSESKHLVEKKLNTVLKDLDKKYATDKVVYNGYDKDFNLEEMLNDLNTMPFLSEHKVVVLENPYFFSSKAGLDDRDSKLFLEFLKNPADFSTLIIYVNQFKVDRRKKVVKDAIKYSEVYQPKELDDYQLSDIIKSDLRKLEINIDQDAFLELVKRVSADFDAWDNEFEKLYLYDKKHLTLKDIDSLITRPNLDNVFDLVNAVVAKDLTKSLITWRYFPKEVKEPISMIMLLASQFRLIHQVITLSNNGFRYQDLASELGVHPYRVKMANQIARNTSAHGALLVLSQLATLEQAIKGGLVDPNIGFELFLIEVCQA